MTERRLRIVDGSDVWQPTSSIVRQNEDGQLEFDLGDEDRVRRILVAVMDRIHGARLNDLVAEIHPTVVLDLRNTIRFDLPGTSRDRFLDIVSRVRSSYMRAPMALQSDFRGPVLIDYALPIRLHHEVVERSDGNLMLLVNKPEHAFTISSLLNVAFSKNHLRRWDIEHAG